MEGKLKDSQHLAYNEHTKLLPLSPFASKVYGLPRNPTTSASSTLAHDKYQGLLAYGTKDRTIKVVSLKGYEFEIYDAHEANIRAICFVPQQGVLLSVDDDNAVAVWDLKNLGVAPEVRVEIPLDEEKEEEGNIVTALYAPQFLSNEPDNHRFVFCAMSSGNIYILDWKTGVFSPNVINYSQMYHQRKGDTVCDIKTHPTMMHRMLIAYEETAVIIYSLNKNREIQQINFGEFDQDKGKALAVEFLSSE